MKPKVYVYRGCDTCRKAMKFLEGKKVEFQEVAIREQPPTKAELKRMLEIYGGDLRKLFNTSGMDYKAMNMKEKLPTLSVEEALKLLSENGNLVKRPFALTDKAGLVGFKEEDWGKVF
ncbi:MAG TPA: arsenate reductase family protein [Verrucomicrobiae bacterium]